MVFKGTLLIDFRDHRTVEVKEGEILIIPKGVEHRPHTKGVVRPFCDLKFKWLYTIYWGWT